TDDKLAEFEAAYGDQLVILRNATNKGFAGGVNTGIRYGIENNFDYIALSNNDAIAEPGWLTNLMTAAKKQASAATTGLLLHADGTTIDSSSDWYSTWGLPFPRGRNKPVATAQDSGFVFGASGGATLYKTSLFETIGLFDETFFAYYEDVDISFRAQLTGHSVYYEKTAIAYHKQGASSAKLPGFGVKQALKNLPLLYIKNVPNGLLLPIGIRFWFAYSLITLKAILSPNFKQALTGWLQGVWLFWTHGIPERFRIQKNKTVSSADIQKTLWHDLPPDQTGLRRVRRMFSFGRGQ
ncbi:MAG: glycosyltransferase family 2 protein, partial [Candidatus Saccharimonadales bacterium]